MPHDRIGTANGETLYASGGGINTHRIWGLGGDDILDSRTTKDGRVLSTSDELYGDRVPQLGQVQYDPNTNPPGVPGHDKLYGGAGFDKLYGDAGDDTLDGGSDNDFLDGGEGFDFADYSSATGAVRVDLFDPSKNGGAASGAAGDDTLVNIEGIIGSNFDDTLEGDNGDNTIYGRDGKDFLDGGIGSDRLYGEKGDDILTGGSQNDYLSGGSGKDKLYGGFDNDYLDGGKGKDVLNAYGSGTELDILEGGADADRFVLGTLGSAFYFGDGNAGYATIVDFKRSQGDKFEVYGSKKDYSLDKTNNWSGGSALDTAIYYKGDLIAVVEDTKTVDLNKDFTFV